jgi:hypothetical protein
MRNARIIIEIILVVAAGVLIYNYIKNTRELAEFKQSNKLVKSQVLKEAKEIARKVDDKGIETVIFDVTGHKAPVEVLSSNASTKGIIDTTAMALDIRTKQLKQILVVKSSLEAENLKLKQQLDPSHRPFYTYSGNGLELKFTPPNDIDSVARADFKANLNITATQYWKRDWFLGAKKSILSVSSNNPMFKINGADFVEIEQKQPTFGLRIQANISYNADTKLFGYGPAARFDVGRFSFQGRYTKYPNDPKWKPSINASYDILRF